MKKVMLSEEANKEITTLLECIIYSNATNPDVRGMYLKEYDFEGRGQPTIEVVLIVAHEAFSSLAGIRKFYYNNIKAIDEKYGIGILITPVLAEDLTYFPDLDFANMDNFDIIMRYNSCRDLMNSQVVYDPEGKYEDLKERMNAVHDKDTLKYDNLIEFVPPIKLERKK